MLDRFDVGLSQIVFESPRQRFAIGVNEILDSLHGTAQDHGVNFQVTYSFFGN